MMKRILYICVALFLSNYAIAQGYVDQVNIVPITESQVGGVENIKPVEWEIYEYKDHIKKDGKGAWNELLSHLDTIPGGFDGKRRYIVELTNRITGENFKIGSKLLLPKSFPNDFRAYSPYPLHYEAAKDLPKLFIIDKYTQTFAAYENGNLARWGLVSTGRSNDLTPTGRYNFNWKAEYRQSSAAPEGEVWEMYWMFNFQAKHGIHVHQYSLPISMPASHGCVRMSESDAKWNYSWANGWVQEGGRVTRNGTPVMVLHDNPAGRSAHWNIVGNQVKSLVRLPDNVMDVEPGRYSNQAVAWASGW